MNDSIEPGYISWVGVVENIDDPLTNGRVKVRIFGWHTEDLIKLPTAVLPWATVMHGPSGGFSAPIPGDFVSGYFADGKSAQNPYIIAVLPGVRDLVANPWDTSKGFSPQPLVPGEKAEPNAPVMNPAIAEAAAKNPTTNSYVSKGIVANTGISLTNSALSHVCDFRYQLQFDIGISGLVNPITAITNAIKNGKNNAANFVAMMIKKLNDTITASLKAIMKAIGLDPTGTTAVIYGKITATLQDINDFIRDVAEYVEVAATIYYLVKNINDIVAYLKSLPARFLAIVQDCITRFLNGAKAFAAQVAAVPGQIGATVESLGKSIQAGADELLGKQKEELANTTIPKGLEVLFSDPLLDHSNTIIQYVSETHGNANTTMATAESNNFDPKKEQWA
jgi:hypothetical protein